MLESKRKNPEETKQTSEPESDVTHILQLSDWECKITMLRADMTNMTNMLRALTGKVNTTQEQQMSCVSRNMARSERAKQKC